MMDEIMAYVDFLLNFKEVQKPDMPKFNIGAYTDNEYLLAVFDLQKDFDFVDDDYLVVKHLKGEWWK